MMPIIVETSIYRVSYSVETQYFASEISKQDRRFIVETKNLFHRLFRLKRRRANVKLIKI